MLKDWQIDFREPRKLRKLMKLRKTKGVIFDG